MEQSREGSGYGHVTLSLISPGLPIHLLSHQTVIETTADLGVTAEEQLVCQQQWFLPPSLLWLLCGDPQHKQLFVNVV